MSKPPRKQKKHWRIHIPGMDLSGDVIAIEYTKSEARAFAKKLYGLPRLPPGTSVVPRDEEAGG